MSIFNIGANHTTDLISFGNASQWQPFPAASQPASPPPANPFLTSTGGGFNPFATAATPVHYATVPQIDPSETREALERKISELEATLRQLLGHLKSLEEENARLKAQLAAKDGTVAAARIEMERKLKEQQLQAEEAGRQIKEHVRHLQQRYEQEKLKLMSDQVAFATNSVNQYMFRFDDPNFAGNKNAMADDILNGTKHLQESYGLLVSTLQDGGDVVGASRLLADHTQKFLADAKGLANRVEDPELKFQIMEGARNAGRMAVRLLNDAQNLSSRGQLTPQERDALRANQTHFNENLSHVRSALTSTAQNKKLNSNIDTIAEAELMKAARMIAEAAQSLKDQAARAAAGRDQLNPADWAAHAAIADQAMKITQATQMLINSAASAQQERVARGIEKVNAGETYHADPMWAEGLISAAKAVANSTKILVGSANKAIVGNVDEATLTACCKTVAAHTAKLQQATRVKSEHDSKAQAQLDQAAKLVKESTNGLVEETKKYSLFEESQIQVKTGSGFNNIKAERELEGTIARLKDDLQKANKDRYKKREELYGAAREHHALKSSVAEQSKPKPAFQKSEIDTTPIASAFGPRGSNQTQKLSPRPEIDTTPIVSPFSTGATKKADPASVPDNIDVDMPSYMKKKLAPVALVNEAKYDAALEKKPALEVAPRPLHLQPGPNTPFGTGSTPFGAPPPASTPFGNAPSSPNPFGTSNSTPFGAPPASSPFGASNSIPFGAPPASSPFGASPPAATPFGNAPSNQNPFGAPLPPPSNQPFSPWG